MTPKHTAAHTVLVKAFPAMPITTRDRVSDWHHDSRAGKSRGQNALQSSHFTCTQYAPLPPPVQAGVRQHARRRSYTARRTARALSNVNDQVRQLLCPQPLKRPIRLSNVIKDVLLPAVDVLA